MKNTFGSQVKSLAKTSGPVFREEDSIQSNGSRKMTAQAVTQMGLRILEVRSRFIGFALLS